MACLPAAPPCQPDPTRAREHAVKEARALAASAVLEGRLTGSHCIEYADENRRRLGAVRFDEAVKITA
ncbi:MAG: hypothetical protein AVDCRST_MAG93-3632 [uncultured Chloroflexia bacterium]|uniref:DUF6894 domain-containing protein n=1 Tax=uncultured Chloroflexia bacterium TaxID=1672391 RepID=A0A6J4JU35_9CHLR|nr:MAG: hypothetical protein AVDCRST_MAG93-3632 [uncultured Chloroflexia bacterium]